MTNDNGLGGRAGAPVSTGRSPDFGFLPSGRSRSLLERSPTAPRRIRPGVLVVDDEPDVLRTVHDLLRIDYDVVTRLTAAEAIELLHSDRTFHVIMSDQRMPGMTGVELLREAEALRPDTTRLLFTAYADIRAVIDAINEGRVFRYIAKPWDPNEFQAVVRQAVEQHDLITEKRRLLAELQESNARLLEANRLKGAFLEVASHELNTPVAVVLGLLDLWKLSIGATAPATERQWIDRLGNAANRLAATVERMLKLVRTGEFGQPLALGPVDLETLARAAADQISAYLESRKQRVEIAVDSNLGTIEADAAKILDVLLNLLVNAVKFTPDEGVIQLSARREGDSHIRVSVTDPGQGVAPGDQPHVFEPFFTGFDTLRHSSGEFEYGKRGIGLGLWLVKSFVEMHGGRVELTSTPGQGATFSFVLPRAQAAPTAAGGNAKA